MRKSQERVDRRGGVGPTLSTRGSSLYLLTSFLFELQQVHLQTLLHLPRLLLGGCLLGTEPRNLTHTQTHTGHMTRATWQRGAPCRKWCEGAHLLRAVHVQLRVQPVVQRRLLQDDADLVLAVRGQTLQLTDRDERCCFCCCCFAFLLLLWSGDAATRRRLTWSAYLSLRQEIT